jgi:predicted alpha/beta-fold hydrolase
VIINSQFKPAWWLPGKHLQTLWPNLIRSPAKVTLHRERLELEDGDFLDLDWTEGTEGPIVLVLHGLGGSSRSQYARGILKAIHNKGWRGVVMHFRGCSNVPNRLLRHYHGGETSDLQTVYQVLKQREPGTPIAVLGYSLGANLLLKWLGELGSENVQLSPPVCAVAVSAPFNLAEVAKKLDSGSSWFYQKVLLRRLKNMVKIKYRKGSNILEPPFDLTPCLTTRTIHGFDDTYTAPLHGFKDADDYYRKNSCLGFLKNIHTPSLIIHSMDDPFMTADIIPADKDLSPRVILELSRSGGHVGFTEGPPWNTRYWLEERIPNFISQQLARSAQPL